MLYSLKGVGRFSFNFFCQVFPLLPSSFYDFLGMANKIEKIMRDFHSAGASREAEDHLVHQNICCKQKKMQV